MLLSRDDDLEVDAAAVRDAAEEARLDPQAGAVDPLDPDRDQDLLRTRPGPALDEMTASLEEKLRRIDLLVAEAEPAEADVARA